MSDMYEVRLGLTVSGPDRASHFEVVVDAYAELEAVHDDLLDSSFGFSDGADEGAMDIEITVSAASEDAAHDLARSSVRAAIQAAGGCTPNWADRSPATPTSVYRVLSESVDRVLA